MNILEVSMNIKIQIHCSIIFMDLTRIFYSHICKGIEFIQKLLCMTDTVDKK